MDSPVVPLHTARLTLREMTTDDLDQVAALLGDPRVMAHYPRPKTRDEARTWIDRSRTSYRTHGFGLWTVTRRGSGEFVGDCGLTVQHVDGVDEIEVGYHVGPAHQGRGYATEAALACRDLARDHFGVTRLIAVITPGNLASQAVAERAGLTLEKRTQVHGLDRLVYAGAL